VAMVAIRTRRTVSKVTTLVSRRRGRQPAPPLLLGVLRLDRCSCPTRSVTETDLRMHHSAVKTPTLQMSG